MADPNRTFLPWVRRGLVARTDPVPVDGGLPAQAAVAVGLRLTGLPESRLDLTLHGPGDVVGIDPRAVIRTDPRPQSTEVEPNYLPLIEFDAPDFPWLFTPASSGPDDRLRPWCVLVVVDLAVADAPRVEPGRPLPVLRLPVDVAGTELPDLAESWAWAHAQLIAPDGESPDAALSARPALNLSRLLAPRRLEPGKRYAACLVPAFDAGVARGLGAAPEAGAPLGPAWPTPPTTDVTLPVYFHWEFSTGTAGDFEQLARRLRPYPVPPSGSGEPMYVGAAGPELPAAPPTDPLAYLAMDGALRAWQAAPDTLEDVPGPIRDHLRTALDGPADQIATGPASTIPVLGPPIYGGWAARQQTVPDDEPRWLRELNLDPRSRAAAGLGAEIARQNQEQFVQWCWEQVEQVLEANRLLSRARLSMEALTRVHAKHLAVMPEDRLLQITAPLHSRTRSADLTVAATIAGASMPAAVADPALRRLTSPGRPVLRAALARAEPTAPPGRTPRVTIVQRLAGPTGGIEVDPTEFVPHGLLGIPAIASVPIPASGDTVNLGSIGLPVDVPAPLVAQVRNDTTRVTADAHPQITLRDDLTAGVLGAQHVASARALQAQVGSPWYSVSDLFSLVPPAQRITDAATIGRLSGAVAHLAEVEIVIGGPPPAFRSLLMGTMGQALLAGTDPRSSVPGRVGAMVTVDGRSLTADATSGLTVAPGVDRVMVAPRIDVPVYGYLATLDPARFLPGVADIPEDSITVLRTNPRFVEALLVGLNDELNRELLWRGYPTDQRGTPFRRFWDRGAGTDIEDIPGWPAGNALGAGGPGDVGGQVALLVRGQLLRRYPNASLYAWRAHGGVLADDPQVPQDLRSPVFAGVLGDDTTFVGFDLSGAELTTGDGWFFVLQEQPVEPRFGFDEAPGPGPPAPLQSWSDATWPDTGTAPGGYLRLAGNPLSGMALGGVRFVDHAASLAAITVQQPMRIAVHAGGIPELENA